MVGKAKNMDNPHKRKRGIIPETQTALMELDDFYSNKDTRTEGASTGRCEFVLDSEDDESNDHIADQTEKKDDLMDDSDFWENGQHFPEDGMDTEDRAEEVVPKVAIFVCRTCNKEFKRKDNMRRHEQSLHRPNGEKHQCGQCGKVFGNLSTMKVHCKRVHEAKAASCIHKGCNKKYKNEYGLRVHIKKAHPDVNNTRQKNICEECGKCFSHRHLLEGHYAVHSGVSRFKCSVCSKAFKYVHNMKAHLKKHTADKAT